MKENLVWTKTILSVYRYLENICGAIDKIILQSGLNSANISGNNYFLNNVETITNRIINLSERKVTLINLKVLTENILESMNPEDAQLLIEKYVDGKKCREIVESKNLSIRSVFRKLDLAEKTFNRKLNFKGYNDSKLKAFLEKEEWIKNAYKNFCNNKTEELHFSNGYLEKVAAL